MKKRCLMFVLMISFVLSAVAADAAGNVIGKFVQDNTTVEVARGEGTEISVTANTVLAGDSSFLYTDLVLFDPTGNQASEYVWNEVYETGQTASVQVVYNDDSEEPSFIISLSVYTDNNGLLEIDGISIYVKVENDKATFTAQD